ncbi:uncharacterized protein LOC114530145 [Dendronephthya gigantea]|uniref:uncharacterized protein LOC114530145 n=1 Tax=Dendronephthya gigantea TaxID=151771 RepID=UPI00106A04B1|nr:uncharacterized protein LOC114530145 [Dendronephthya gigantea]
MSHESGIAGTTIKWGKEYRHYRSSRCRLYLCMMILMIFVALSVVCATFLFRNSFHFYPKAYELNTGEMRVVKLSNLFCEGVVVKPAKFKRQLLVMSTPLARRTSHIKWTSKNNVVLRRDRTWYRSFYLLKDSTVSVRVVSSHSVNVYWLKGRKILDKWNDEMRKDLKETSKQISGKFTGTRMAETFTLKEDNNYYLGITSIAGNAKYSEIFVNTSIDRVMYDVNSCVTSCNASVNKSCQVTLRFNSADTAVIRVPSNVTGVQTHDVWVSWYCEPRIWFYVVAFVGSFLFVVSALGFVYCCIMSRVNKKIREWKPHVVTVRESTTKENSSGVKLTSINNRENTSDDNFENILELTPLRLSSTRENCQENNKPEIPNKTSTPKGLNSVDDASNNNPCSSAQMTSFIDANCADSVIEPTKTISLWRRSPSPRWSTFFSEDDYEECVTNFRESPNSTLDSIKKASEDDYFETELMDRLQNLTSDYDGPVETDIDDIESEKYPFLSETSGDNPEIALRQKDKRKEQRWEPRLSVVTEI